MTRQYFPECVIEVDKGKYRAAIMNIECVDDVPPPTQYAIDDLSAGLDRLVAFMHDTVDAGLGVSAIVGMSNIEYDNDAHSTPTRIGADGQLAVEEEEHEEYTSDEVFDMIDPKVVANNLPGPGIGYSGVSFKIADDEAILIEGTDVPCRYWSCQVFDNYLQSGRLPALSGRDQQSSGRVRPGRLRSGSMPCRENPGVKNWVSTEGRRRGQVVLRTLLAETDLLPEMSVIKLAEIPAHDRA